MLWRVIIEVDSESPFWLFKYTFIADNEKIFINGVIVPTKSQEFSIPTDGEISKLNVTNGKIVNI